MKFHIHKNIVLIIILILFLILIFLSTIWIYRYSEIYPKPIINRQKLSELSVKHRLLGQNNIQGISSWMTFDYINHVFNLPQAYLKDTLSIQDSRYPKLTIIRYAHENKIDQNIITIQVQDAVKKYFVSLNSQ